MVSKKHNTGESILVREELSFYSVGHSKFLETHQDLIACCFSFKHNLLPLVIKTFGEEMYWFFQQHSASMYAPQHTYQVMDLHSITILIWFAS